MEVLPVAVERFEYSPHPAAAELHHERVAVGEDVAHLGGRLGVGDYFFSSRPDVGKLDQAEVRRSNRIDGFGRRCVKHSGVLGKR